jgi:hypothetical protein
MTVINGFIEYGKKLETLGKRFQDPECKLQDLFAKCLDLGLMVSFRVEPDPNPNASVDLTVTDRQPV